MKFDSLLMRLLLIAVAALLPAVALQIVIQGRESAAREQILREEAMRLLLQVRSEQQRIVEGAAQVLSMIASTPAVRAQSSEGCIQLLGNLLRDEPRYLYANVTALDGKPICTPVVTEKDLNPSDRAYFKRALQSGALSVGDYAVGRYSGKPSLHLARPYMTNDGRVGGIVEVALSLEWLNAELAKISAPPGSVLVIGDRNGVILARSPGGMAFAGREQPADRQFLMQGTQIGTTDHMRALDDGRFKLVTYSPPGADPNGLLVTASLDQEAVFAKVTQANTVELLLIACSGFLTLGITGLIAHKLISRPINGLIHASDRLRSGARGVRAGLGNRQDAFGRLANAFDAMAETLERREQDLRQSEAHARELADHLEQQVQLEVAAREDAQMRAARAERIQALGLLAGGIAHDFNNLLQVVMGASILIEDDPGDPGQVRSLAHLVTEEAERGAGITRRLLTVGRVGDLRTETLNLAALLSALREIFMHTLGSEITVLVEVVDGLPDVVVDRAQLETTLINLAANARDAMPHGGRLLIRAATETVAMVPTTHPAGLAPGNYIRLSVSDTGSGMDPATLARVGQPFFTTKRNGTGLGLAMAQGFAEQSGGGIEIVSKPSNGTTVTLWLPTHLPGLTLGAPLPVNPPAAPSTPAMSVQARQASPVVLVVDDEPGIRRVIATILTRGGMSVTVAGDGVEALAVLERGGRVDLLVTDLSMPGMNGIALIAAAQAQRPGLPTLLLTGYAGDGVTLAVNGAIDGSYSLLRKPIRSAQLLERVRALLSEQTRFGEQEEKKISFGNL